MIGIGINLKTLELLSKYLDKETALSLTKELTLEEYNIRQEMKTTIIQEFTNVVRPQFTFPGAEILPPNTIGLIDEKYDYSHILEADKEEIEFTGIPKEYFVNVMENNCIIEIEILKLKGLFHNSFINKQNELILVPETNLYFGLYNIETLTDLYCKIIAWCSRDACKSMPYYSSKRNEKYQAMVRTTLNEYLGTDFSKEDWMFIYTYLGNDIRRELCEKFVESGYDLSVIKKECENK